MRILIDTSFVVALVNKNDENHDAAVQLSLEFNNVPAIITDSVLLEIGNSLARNHKEDAVRMIERFIVADEVEIVRLDDDLSKTDSLCIKIASTRNGDWLTAFRSS